MSEAKFVGRANEESAMKDLQHVKEGTFQQLSSDVISYRVR